MKLIITQSKVIIGRLYGEEIERFTPTIQSIKFNVLMIIKDD